MTAKASAIIATKNRPESLRRTVMGIASQLWQPAELIIVDASDNFQTRDICTDSLSDFDFPTFYVKAEKSGAAIQRAQGVALAKQSVIWFLDDDIVLEEDCAQRLWEGINLEGVGAVNAMITNQRYTRPGLLTRCMYRIMHGRKLDSYAGKIIGPAWNLLPEDEPWLPEYNSCEWLNTTCTMYKRSALPNPIFPGFFTGYSFMEDVALTAAIARNYKLMNARTARIFHDSQSGVHKDQWAAMARMELVNRYYVMTRVLQRIGLIYTLKFTLFQLFGVVTSVRNPENRRNILKTIGGKISGICFLLKRPWK